MQPINKEIENILINKSYGSLSQSERTIIKTCFESQCEFENAQKILRCSKLLFVNDINQNIPIISNLVFEKAFLNKRKNKSTKRKSVVLNFIYAAATICLVIIFTFLFKNYQKKPELTLLSNNDTVLITNSLNQHDTITNQNTEIKIAQKQEVIKKKHKKSIDKNDDNEIYHYDYNDITFQLLSMDFSSIVNIQNQDTINSN